MLKNINEHLEHAVTDLLGEDNVHFRANASMLEIHLHKENLLQVVKFLCDEAELLFTSLIDIFGVDYPGREKRFEVCYLLLSTRFNYRVCLKIHLEESEQAPSICQLFPSSIWFEREVYDMYGVVFEGNPDMRRILTDYGFEGFPLRKDFPLTGYKEVRYDFDKGAVLYEPVNLVQDYRNFDFISPWEGTEYKLPGDEKAKEKK